MLWLPCASAGTLKVTVPFVPSVWEPNFVVPSLKVTVPVGSVRPALAMLMLTFAVRVME